MPPFEAQDPAFEERVRGSFARQPFMATLGARLTRVEPGAVDILLPYRPDLTQQHGFVHAGAVTSVVDSACGYAAFTLMPADAGVLSVEFKINLVAPARGDELIARGRVERPGRTLSTCRGEVMARTDGEEKLVAVMLATMMTVRGRDEVRG